MLWSVCKLFTITMISEWMKGWRGMCLARWKGVKMCRKGERYTCTVFNFTAMLNAVTISAILRNCFTGGGGYTLTPKNVIILYSLGDYLCSSIMFIWLPDKTYLLSAAAVNFCSVLSRSCCRFVSSIGTGRNCYMYDRPVAKGGVGPVGRPPQIRPGPHFFS